MLLYVSANYGYVGTLCFFTFLMFKLYVSVWKKSYGKALVKVWLGLGAKTLGKGEEKTMF